MGNPIKVTVILEGDENSFDYYRETLKEAYEYEQYHETRLLNSANIVSVEMNNLDEGQLISLITYRRSVDVLRTFYVLETMDEIHDMWIR